VTLLLLLLLVPNRWHCYPPTVCVVIVPDPGPNPDPDPVSSSSCHHIHPHPLPPYYYYPFLFLHSHSLHPADSSSVVAVSFCSIDLYRLPSHVSSVSS